VNSEASAIEIKNKLVRLNILRGKGILCKNIMEAQLNSTKITHIYAFFIALFYDKVGSFNLLVKTRFLISLIWYF